MHLRIRSKPAGTRQCADWFDSTLMDVYEEGYAGWLLLQSRAWYKVLNIHSRLRFAVIPPVQCAFLTVAYNWLGELLLVNHSQS